MTKISSNNSIVLWTRFDLPLPLSHCSDNLSVATLQEEVVVKVLLDLCNDVCEKVGSS